MLLFLLSACIENEFQEPPKDRSFDTGAPVEDTDTDAPDDTEDTEDTDLPDTDLPGDTDTGVPVDTGVDTVDTDTVDTDTVDTDTGGDTVDTDVDLSPPGPIAVVGVCDSTWSGWADPASTVPELHVVGVYESQDGYPGPAYVTVSRAEEMVLVLSSYSAVDWQVELAVGTDITEIVVASYDVSTVTFTSVTTAPVTYAGWIGACAYEIPDVSPSSGCETPDLEAAVEARTSLAMSSFQGCYAGGEFSVE